MTLFTNRGYTIHKKLATIFQIGNTSKGFVHTMTICLNTNIYTILVYWLLK